jgi:hypothetical protein
VNLVCSKQTQFHYLGNFGRIIVHWRRINWPHNVHLHASKMCLCGLDLEILYARLKNSFAQNLLGDAQLQ